VGRELVGCSLHVDAGTPQHVVARIVEVEAYLGLDDPASHAYRGPTPRAKIMFEEPGHLYVYLSRGIHHCANLVTESTGTAGAVLLRAAVVERGEETVRARRGAVAETNALLRGPGNLCRGLGLTLLDNGIDVCSRGSRVRVMEREGNPRLLTGRRVGITAATDRQLRFAWSGHPAVSSPVRK
jgi:DNA-3-methyladenine glycosylase